MGSALIYGTSFDGLSLLLTIYSFRGKRRDCQEGKEERIRSEGSLDIRSRIYTYKRTYAHA